LDILIVSQYFWPESFRINDLARALRERGHRVTVLTGLPNYPNGRIFPGYALTRGPWRQTFEEVPIFRVPLIPRGSGSGLRLSLNFVSFALTATVLGALRLRSRPDVILAYEPSPITVALPAIALKRLHKAPFVLWVQDLWPEVLEATGAVTSKRILRLVSALTSWIYRQCDEILAQSTAFVPLIEAHGPSKSKIGYLPNWAEDFYRPVEVEAGAAEAKELPSGFRILFAGNLGESQGLATILAAAEALRTTDIKWVIVGDGRRREWMREQIVKRGLTESVHMLGSKPAESMPRYFALADALLVSLKADPLYSWTVPSKLQTYMACGKPILAALDGEGARIVKESGAGVVARPEDAEGLASAALCLLELPESAREELGERALRYFNEHFRRELVVDKLEKGLSELAGSTR
jgi:colanic acid biosynthesis glycosyl transferase WcaI